MSKFSETMKRIREEKQMSQEEFAKLLGTSKQNISRYELGEVSPKISTATAYAKKLGITLSELNGEDAHINETGEGTIVHYKHSDTRILAEGFDNFPEDARKTIMDIFYVYNEKLKKGNDDK